MIKITTTAKIATYIAAIAIIATSAITACKKKPPQKQETTQQAQPVEKQLPPLPQPEYDREKIIDAIAKGDIRSPITNITFVPKKLSESIDEKRFQNAYIYSQSAIRLCYLNALPDNRQMAGNAEFTLHVDENGNTELKELKLDEPIAAIEPCLKNALEKWKFHTSGKNTPATVSAQLTFEAKEPPPIDNVDTDEHHGHHGHQH